MTIEQNLKTLLGEYSFQLCALQQQVADLTEENSKLKINQVNVSSSGQSGGVTTAAVNEG